MFDVLYFHLDKAQEKNRDWENEEVISFIAK